MLDSSAIKEKIRALGQALGFDRLGFCRITEMAQYPAFLQWLDRGRAGTMSYLARHHHLRRHPALLLEGAQTAIVGVTSYARQEEGPVGERATGMVARFARGADYHQVLRQRLDQLWLFIQQHTPAAGDHFIAVDSAPLLERELAMTAGVGFFGKNTLLITPRVGSYTVIGTLLLTLPLPPDPPARPRCGRCERCLAACPTGALVAPYQLDARRCISYLTIEHRLSVEHDLRHSIAPWIFGCDRCQEVCPYNIKAARRGAPDPDLAPEKNLARLELAQVLRLRAGEYRRLVRGRPLQRVSRAQLARNAALVVAGVGGPQEAGLRQQLKQAATEGHPLVVEAAQWTLEHLHHQRKLPAR